MDLNTRGERDSSGQFLVEGEKEIALTNKIDVLYYVKLTPFVIEMGKKASEVVAMSKDLLDKVCYRGSNEVAVCRAKLNQLDDLKGKTLLLACESIEKPGNLGAILRTCDAAGVEGVIVSDPIVDVFNPNVVRASLGALFSLPIVQVTSIDALQFLDSEKLQVIVTTPKANMLYHEVDFTLPTCIIIGSESKGLSQDWLSSKNCIPVKIPMMGHVDSLNASISASIVIYEALRQRNSLSR
jgi:RNA methyltransferase, TrmH family